MQTVLFKSGRFRDNAPELLKSLFMCVALLLGQAEQGAVKSEDGTTAASSSHAQAAGDVKAEAKSEVSAIGAVHKWCRERIMDSALTPAFAPPTHTQPPATAAASSSSSAPVVVPPPAKRKRGDPAVIDSARLDRALHERQFCIAAVRYVSPLRK